MIDPKDRLLASSQFLDWSINSSIICWLSITLKDVSGLAYRTHFLFSRNWKAVTAAAAPPLSLSASHDDLMVSSIDFPEIYRDLRHTCPFSHLLSVSWQYLGWRRLSMRRAVRVRGCRRGGGGENLNLWEGQMYKNKLFPRSVYLRRGWGGAREYNNWKVKIKASKQINQATPVNVRRWRIPDRWLRFIPRFPHAGGLGQEGCVRYPQGLPLQGSRNDHRQGW